MNLTLFTDLRFVASSAPTGVGKHILHMAAGLANTPGWSLQIAACTDQVHYVHGSSNGNRLGNFPTSRLPLTWKQAEAIWTLAGGPATDRYFPGADWVYCPKNDFIPLKLIPVAVTIHGAHELDPQMPRPRSLPAILNRLRRRLSYRRITRQAKLILTVSEFLKAQVVDWFGVPAERIAVVGNGVEDCYYRARSLPLHDAENFQKPFILCVGGLNRLDGGDRVVQLAQDLQRRHADIHVIVAGRQHDPHLLAAAGELKNLRLLGYVPSEKLAAIMARALFLFLPTRYETFGMAAAEAMAAGLPVLTGRVTAVPEICGEAAVYADLDSNGEVLDRAVQLVGSDSLRNEYAHLGFHRANSFTWQACVQRLTTALSERTT